jgi:hypothetical protein
MAAAMSNPEDGFSPGKAVPPSFLGCTALQKPEITSA